MCLAVPSKIVEIKDNVATIDVYGARKEISLTLLPEMPRVGDFVLTHAGFAIQTIVRESVESGEVMHESSIVLSILDIAEEQCREQGCGAVNSIRVRIGKAAGVLPDSLLFAFDALKENTIAKQAQLIIDVVPVGGKCNGCEKEFDVDGEPYIFACPLCGSSDFVIERGREMEVEDMEMQ